MRLQRKNNRPFGERAKKADSSAKQNAAVNAFNKELLANHIRGCVVRDIRDGKDEVIDELVATLQKLMK